MKIKPAARRTTPFDFDVSQFPPLPRLKGLLVTATDTEVGKTVIAGAIAARLAQGGRRVEVFKPVATGCRSESGTLVSADAEFLAACADSGRTLEQICPVRYRSAVAPNAAAARERRPVDLEAIFREYGSLAGQCDCVVVEGVGGLLCPIRDDFWVIHLAKMLQLPLVIVARAGLGTVNHTLLTLHAARSAGLTVAGVVVNRYRLEPPRGPLPADYPRGDEDLAMHTNPQQIAQLGQVDVLTLVGEDAETSVERIVLGADVQFAVKQVDWERLMT